MNENTRGRLMALEVRGFAKAVRVMRGDRTHFWSDVWTAFLAWWLDCDVYVCPICLSSFPVRRRCRCCGCNRELGDALKRQWGIGGQA